MSTCPLENHGGEHLLEATRVEDNTYLGNLMMVVIKAKKSTKKNRGPINLSPSRTGTPYCQLNYVHL